jgi:hypothetical protein
VSDFPTAISDYHSEPNRTWVAFGGAIKIQFKETLGRTMPGRGTVSGRRVRIKVVDGLIWVNI